MSPPVSFTKTKLDYPVFAADFDPYNRGYLIVGGGGGPGNHGVRNTISLLDCSSRATLETVAEVQLSQEEDSITSIANLASKDGLVTLAGINSSEKEQKAGKNEHMRTFSVKYPKRKRAQDKSRQTEEKEDASAEGSITIAGKAALFKPHPGPKPETYQRVLKLSPARKRESGSKRIGVIASSLAKQSEIVVFDATRTPITPAEIITTVTLPTGLEANDIDIYDSGENEFSIVYCTDYDIYEQTITYNFQTRKSEMTPRNPRRFHSVPAPDPRESSKGRPVYRSVRFLNNSQNVLALANKPGRTGADLSIVHLYPTGPGIVHFHKVLPPRTKQAMSMDVCALDADKDGSKQIVVAVAGQDQSIEVYALNYLRHTDTFSAFKSFTTLRDVHNVSITALRFEPFHSPIRASPEAEKPAHPLPQYVRLASTSMGNTVVVDTFALQPLETQKRDSRYVLLHPNDERYSRNITIAVISFVVLISAMLLQSYLFPDQASALRSYLPAGARDFLSQPANAAQGMGKDFSDAAAKGYSSISNAVPDAVPSSANKLRDILHLHRTSADAEHKAVILRSQPGETDVSVDVHADREEYLKQDTNAKHWHELEEWQRQTWIERLEKAGHWTVQEGEAVLKGVLFSEWAGFVGGVAGEVIREL